MAVRTYDVWLERFKREAGIKSAIILYGNVTDILYSEKQKVYVPTVQVIADILKSKGFKNVVKWDRVDGLDEKFDRIPLADSDSSEDGCDYDMGDSILDVSDDDSYERLSDPDQFFPYLLQTIRNSKEKNAFILDYSDYIFGNPNSLSEKERSYLTSIGKSLAVTKSYNMMNASLMNDIGNIVIILAQNNASIPPSLYINNPMVASISVPLPGRNERERFIDSNIHFLTLAKDLRSPKNKQSRDDFIDSLDGLSLCEIVQIMKLSNQVKDDNNRPLTSENLLNLFKYGEKVSPWEELSKEKLETITERLSTRVKGQEDAISKVRDVIIRAYTGFSGLQHSAKQKKPKGTLFFVGPTGVGKTELAKSLAEFVFGDENACIRFDMSEFNHEHSDQRLVGAPPGYVGYEAGGQLTNAVKARPFCVLLFDEIEKAHGKILDKFLQILEDGRLTDGKGETVYFSETIIIFTSNIGTSLVSPEQDKKAVANAFIGAVKEHFINQLGRPELLNRIGNNIVAFNFINDPKVFTKIAEIKFENISSFVKERYHAELKFEDQEAAFMSIAKQAGTANGGRGLLNVMETFIVNPLSDFIFENIEHIEFSTIVISQPVPNKPVFLFDFE